MNTAEDKPFETVTKLRKANVMVDEGELVFEFNRNVDRTKIVEVPEKR